MQSDRPSDPSELLHLDGRGEIPGRKTCSSMFGESRHREAHPTGGGAFQPPFARRPPEEGIGVESPVNIECPTSDDDRQARTAGKAGGVEETEGIKSCPFSIVSPLGWDWDSRPSMPGHRSLDECPTSPKSVEATGTIAEVKFWIIFADGLTDRKFWISLPAELGGHLLLGPSWIYLFPGTSLVTACRQSRSGSPPPVRNSGDLVPPLEGTFRNSIKIEGRWRFAPFFAPSGLRERRCGAKGVALVSFFSLPLENRNFRWARPAAVIGASVRNICLPGPHPPSVHGAHRPRRWKSARAGWRTALLFGHCPLHHMSISPVQRCQCQISNRPCARPPALTRLPARVRAMDNWTDFFQ
jgi:hypothetical protein